MTVKFISHRGNLNGPQVATENTIKQIESVIKKSFDCEIDVWFENDMLFLGHDNPENPVTMEWLQENKRSLWIHCKNFEALTFFSNFEEDFNYFWHQEDHFTLTSKNFIWTYPDNIYSKNSVLVKLDNSLPDNLNLHAICSDYVDELSFTYSQKINK